MGLDVYLYEYDNLADTLRREKAAEKALEGLYSEEFTDEERDRRRAMVAAEFGTDKWGEDKVNKRRIEEPSAIHADHLFKCGYFHSSYNEGGCERVWRAMGVPTLHEIFDTDGHDYLLQVGWGYCLIRAREALDAYNAATSKPSYRAHAVGPNAFLGIPAIGSEEEALAIFKREAGREQPSSFESYSNRDGHFWLGKPMQHLAAIPGKDPLGTPCVWLVYQQSDETRDWYRHALEIVVETCEWVLGQPDPARFVLHWSG